MPYEVGSEAPQQDLARRASNPPSGVVKARRMVEVLQLGPARWTPNNFFRGAADLEDLRGHEVFTLETGLRWLRPCSVQTNIDLGQVVIVTCATASATKSVIGRVVLSRSDGPLTSCVLQDFFCSTAVKTLTSSLRLHGFSCSSGRNIGNQTSESSAGDEWIAQGRQGSKGSGDAGSQSSCLGTRGR